jgi:hypothetical protein
MIGVGVGRMTGAGGLIGGIVFVMYSLTGVGVGSIAAEVWPRVSRPKDNTATIALKKSVFIISEILDSNG